MKMFAFGKIVLILVALALVSLKIQSTSGKTSCREMKKKSGREAVVCPAREETPREPGASIIGDSMSDNLLSG
ncbi:hypothetical protein [Flavihumibacter petaseus]|uniref:Uncharacterized protein n=1 Tax=Flavihumibacter petaseus NBRC 106054 TaxID=1220578 RepID=A0A0E9N662_9BACT|nr:hypothetical protein [Flavihumibacter petaseus]GAO45293.1 hypothetical protein FPE01S_04_05370 [Flavihumibacter petaseus NBRC 106054]